MILAGRRILCTRSPEQAAPLRRRLEALGAQTFALATIEIAPPTDPTALSRALGEVAQYDWVVFTSANGVRAVDPAALHGARIAAVGPATAAALHDAGLEAALVPERHSAADLAHALRDAGVAGRRLLLLRSDIARPELPALLVAGGARVDDVAAYRTLGGEQRTELLRLLDAGTDAVLFTSGSSARHFVRLAGERLATLWSPPRYVSIGPATSEALESVGLVVAAQAMSYNLDGLVAAVAGLWV